MNSITHNSSNVGRSRKIITFLLSLFVLICFYPYEFHSVYFLFLPEVEYILYFVLLLLVLVTSSILGKFKYESSAIWKLFVVQWFGYLIYFCIHSTVLAVAGQTMKMLLAITLVYFIESNIGLYSFFKKYNLWIFIMALLGSIAWFLSTYKGFQPLYMLPDRANDERLILNYLLTFTSGENSQNMRYAGFFDEPGTMAYWGLYALVFNKLFIKEKWIEWPLIICLLFTFSIGFYLMIILYLILFNLKKNNSTKIFISVLMISLIAFGINSTKGTNLDFVYELTLGRIENSYWEGKRSGNVFAVDDRSELAKLAKNEFTEHPFFGTNRDDLEVGNNAYETLALHGIIGSMFVLSPFIWILFRSIKRKDYDIFKADILFIAGFVHRPFHNALLYFFIIYCFIVLYEKTYMNSSRKVII